MADGTTFVKVTTTQATPEDYLLSGAASIDLLAVRADFDGSGAGGDFLPVVQIVNEADEVMLTFAGEKVTAGDSASITFAPFLRGQAASTPAGSGIQFDVANIGDWLSIETLDTTNNGQRYENDGDGGITLLDHGATGITLHASSSDLDLSASGDATLASDRTTVSGTSGLRLSTATDVIDVGRSAHQVTLQGPSGAHSMVLTAGGAITLDSGSGSLGVSATGGVGLQPASGDPVNVLIRGTTSLFIDGGSPGNTIFRVDYNEGTDTVSYHIRTGAVWQADL